MDAQHHSNTLPAASGREALRPEVEVQIAGRSYRLRWDHSALYELQGYADDIATAGDYRKLLIFVWALIVPPNPFKTPKELAAHIHVQDTDRWSGIVLETLRRGQVNGMPNVSAEEADPDPLSVTGHSPDAGSASATTSSGA